MSSLKDLASLIMIPSLVKDGRLDTVKPLGNSIIHPDATGNNDGTDGSTPAEGNFTFSRGSNLAATRVDASQLIEKGRENILTYSNGFSYWTIIGSTLTSNQAGYDGSNDAWLIGKTADAGRIQINVDAGLSTYSVYAKAGSVSWIRLLKGGNASAYFDLSNGTIGDLYLSIDATITSVGGGWYRCTMTYQDSFAGTIRIYPAIADSDTSGTSGNIYIQDAQVERSLVATPYIETGASTAQSGILEDLPRLDYSGGASCPALLLEPQRTNQCSQSEYIGHSDWNQAAITRSLVITQTSETNPEGASICWKIQGTAANNQLANNSSTTSGTTITNSIYVKRVSGTGNVLLRDVNNSQTSFSLSVADGWKRIDVTGTATSGTARFYLNLIDFNDEILVWGAQQEAGSYPTSYIPTMGSAVTRSNDSCFATSVSDLIGQEQGTIFIDANLSAVTDTNLRGLFEISDGTSSNRISIYRNTGGTQATLYSAFSGTATLGIQFNTSAKTKIAFNYSSSGVTLYVNGSLVDTDSVVSIPACNRIDIGVITQLASRSLGDSISQVSLFKTALTNAELAALTTI